MFKKIFNLFKDPVSPKKRRKYLFWLGVSGVIIVFIHQLTKFLLNENTLNIFLFDIFFASICMILILIALYGKDKLISVFYRF